MAHVGHLGHVHDADGRSVFRVFAPEKAALHVVIEGGERLALTPDDHGHWTGALPALRPGSLYWLEVDGRRVPDPASRWQPQGVHGPSMVVAVQPVASPGWTGVRIDDAVIYELHVGTFTAEGTLAAAQARLQYLQALGINMIELLPLAAFPGERNWGYDGVSLFALHAAYGTWADLKAFIEAAHVAGIAVILDVVYNHFGPEGNYSGALAPYTKAAATPWGAAINFDGEWNHGVRAFFVENTRFWLEDVGFDGFRMDAVSLIFDNMPVHILRECTDLARRIGAAHGRHIVMIAEHLRNNRYVTDPAGFGFDAQWSDDLHHALFARLSGETTGHRANFGAFDDVVAALRYNFVLDGTRFDRYHRHFLGTDGRGTEGREHVVHSQNHDQVGNRPRGDRIVSSCGLAKALLAFTAVMASPCVPMLFMGEEYGETAPFLFFEDFGDPGVIDGVRRGRQADIGGIASRDPHDRAAFVDSKLQWARASTPEGAAFLTHYRRLISLKRAGQLGPRRRADVQVTADAATEVMTVRTPHTVTVLNFSAQARRFEVPAGHDVVSRTVPSDDAALLPAFGAVVFIAACAAS